MMRAAELGRQERNITPVDLATDEIYKILRKRLFISLPGQAEIDDIAATFGRKLEEASKAKTVTRGAEAMADEIAATYPFHPRLKNVIALFKENDQFKQTRGLIELVSRLLKSVWERPANDVFLIGPQHFDLSSPKSARSWPRSPGCGDVIARDLWEEQQGGARPGHRPAGRHGLRPGGRCPAPHRQPLDRRQRGQGPDARGDGRVPRHAAAGAV